MNVKKNLVCLISISLFVSTSSAQDKRIEIETNYEWLSPHETYGSWKNLSLSFFHRYSRDFTYFLGTSSFSRDKEGSAILFDAGAYKDWTDSFYTYTSVSSGTNSNYLPQFRFDNEFNFKMTNQKNIVLTGGFTYIDYHDAHKDYIASLGATYYKEGYNIAYKHFFNKSDPGNVNSGSDLVSVGVGEEGKSWTYLDISYGKQAYLATSLLSPEEVREDALYIGLNYRKWLSRELGLLTRVNYFELEDGYKKYGISFGFFREF